MRDLGTHPLLGVRLRGHQGRRLDRRALVALARKGIIMAISPEEFCGRINEVLGQLELEVLDSLDDVAWEHLEVPGRVPAELIRAQRSLREAQMELERYVDERKAPTGVDLIREQVKVP